MAAQPDVTLAATYTARYNRLRTAAGVAVGRAWDQLANVDDDAAQRFAETAATLALAAQTQTAATVDGYLALLLGVIEGEGSSVGLDPSTVSGAAVRAGADPLEVYQRPIITARAALAEGRAWAEAMAIGRLRAVGTAETDVALTQRAAMVDVASRDNAIVGYRRTLTGSSCTLCATASTQRYRTGDLSPIHARCDCGVAPIIGKRDPGHVINRRLVADLKKATSSGDYARNRHVTVDEDGTVRFPDVSVHEHGELGPTLTEAGQDFTGPSDVAA